MAPRPRAAPPAAAAAAQPRPPPFSQGIRNIPNKLRIIISRRRNEDEEDKEEMYSLVTLADSQETKSKGVVVLEA
jgi:large subunit ribosomal protein L31e